VVCQQTFSLQTTAAEAAIVEAAMKPVAATQLNRNLVKVIAILRCVFASMVELKTQRDKKKVVPVDLSAREPSPVD